MSLILVKDNTNSKLRELECDANGLLKVDKVDVSALATESTVSTMNGKITACDTGSIAGTVAVSSVSGNVSCTHASLPLPSGASTSANQSTANTSLASIDGKITACDTSALATSALQSSGNTSLSSIDGKITACDTTALATSANQSTGNTSLATIAGCVSNNILSVSAGSVSKTGVYVWGSSSSTASISGNSSANSSVVDCDGFKQITIAGSTSNLNDSNIEIEVSINNSEFFELTSSFLSIDYNSGQFGMTIDTPIRYVRLKRQNTQLTSESIKAVISGH